MADLLLGDELTILIIFFKIGKTEGNNGREKY